LRCPSISRVVIPREYIEMILSSKPVNRVCPLAHLRQFAAEDPCNSLILLAGAVSDAKM